jgi:hypothetical protein
MTAVNSSTRTFTKIEPAPTSSKNHRFDQQIIII